MGNRAMEVSMGLRRGDDTSLADVAARPPPSRTADLLVVAGLARDLTEDKLSALAEAGLAPAMRFRLPLLMSSARKKC